jgi:DNA-binding GntR family transcriptional regulator
MIVSTPIRKRIKLGDEVAGYLREALVSGVFHPGQRLIIEDLAEQLDVSAMPVREALVALANDGLVDALPNRGFRAVAVTRQDISDVLVLTKVIGGMLVERAAGTITVDTIRTLGELHRQIERAAATRDSRRRFRAIESLNRRFHDTIIASAESKRLQWFYRASVRLAPRSVAEGLEEWVTIQVTDHPPIIAALQRRDGPEARQLSEAHSSRVADMVLAHLEVTGFWDKTSQRQRATKQTKGKSRLPDQLVSRLELPDNAVD